MTTKVDISCPDNSHWNVRVSVQDQVYDPDKQIMTPEWRETQSHVIAPGGRLDGLYLTSSRRVLLEEIARDA